MSDAAFNKFTDMSLNAILNERNKIRIFMSATGNHMKSYIHHYKELHTIDYHIPSDYSYIKKLTFFHTDESFEKLADWCIKNNKKAIFFIESAKKAYKLYKKYQDYALFNCSKSNEHYKYVVKNKINEMLQTQKFNELLLFTTTVMDAGVNINDKNLNYMVVDVQDTRTLIQCVGRKRLQNKNDYLNLFIKSKSNKQLGGMKRKVIEKFEKPDYLIWNGVEEYIKKYGRDPDEDHIVYDVTVDEVNKGTKEINELKYFKLKTDYGQIEKMISLGDYGYCKYIAKMFGFYNEDTYTYQVLEEEDKNKQLERYLNSVVGKVMLRAADRKELIEKINVRDGNNNRLLKHIDTLNAKLKEIGLDYVIVKFETSRMINGKRKKFKQAWKVRRLSDS